MNSSFTLNINLILCVSFSIGKGSGYKKSEVSGLVEGSTLLVGGKEIEVRKRTLTVYVYPECFILLAIMCIMCPHLGDGRDG